SPAILISDDQSDRTRSKVVRGVVPVDRMGLGEMTTAVISRPPVARQKRDMLPPDSRSILLVGEDPLLSRALARMLRLAGYLVVTPSSPERRHAPLATELPAEAKPPAALVIVDVSDDRLRRGYESAPSSPLIQSR